jgi:hypothetical protein
MARRRGRGGKGKVMSPYKAAFGLKRGGGKKR